MTPSPTPTEIAKCPNKECGAPCYIDGTDAIRYNVVCDRAGDSKHGRGCGYFGPAGRTAAEAIRLHNALCAPALAPFEKLIPELRAEAEENKSQSTYFVGWGDACDYLADRLYAVVEEVRGK